MSIKETAVETVKASPPLSVTGLHLFGVSLADITYLATILYTAFMLYFLIRDKWWRQRGK